MHCLLIPKVLPERPDIYEGKISGPPARTGDNFSPQVIVFILRAFYDLYILVYDSYIPAYDPYIADNELYIVVDDLYIAIDGFLHRGR